MSFYSALKISFWNFMLASWGGGVVQRILRWLAGHLLDSSSVGLTLYATLDIFAFVVGSVVTAAIFLSRMQKPFNIGLSLWIAAVYILPGLAVLALLMSRGIYISILGPMLLAVIVAQFLACLLLASRHIQKTAPAPSSPSSAIVYKQIG